MARQLPGAVGLSLAWRRPCANSYNTQATAYRSALADSVCQQLRRGVRGRPGIEAAATQAWRTSPGLSASLAQTEIEQGSRRLPP